MRLKLLPQWLAAKKHAVRIANASHYNDWLKDIGRLKKALLVDHLPESTPRTMTRDAIDIAYKIHNRLDFVDESVLDAKYNIPEVPIPLHVEDTTVPLNNIENRKRGFAISVLAAVAVAISLFSLGPKPDSKVEGSKRNLIVMSDKDHNHSDGEAIAEDVVGTSETTKPNPEFEALADSDGYFPRDGKLYLRIRQGDTVWSRLWRGRFKFYASWDETLQRVLEHNPSTSLDRLSIGAELVVINLNDVDYLTVLENSLRR